MIRRRLIPLLFSIIILGLAIVLSARRESPWHLPAVAAAVLTLVFSIATLGFRFPGTMTVWRALALISIVLIVLAVATVPCQDICGVFSNISNGLPTK